MHKAKNNTLGPGKEKNWSSGYSTLEYTSVLSNHRLEKYTLPNAPSLLLPFSQLRVCALTFSRSHTHTHIHDESGNADVVLS